MHDTGTCLDDRHLGGIAYESDEFLATTWNTKVDVAHSLEQFSRGLMRGWQQRNDIGIDMHTAEHPMDKIHPCLTRQNSVFATFQDACIATLQTKGEDIKRDVGTCLINHTDDTKGNTHTTKLQPVGQRLVLEHFAQRRRQGGYMAHVVGNLLEPCGCELQTVIHGIALVHQCQILSVGSQQRLCFLFDGIGHKTQQTVAQGIVHVGK